MLPRISARRIITSPWTAFGRGMARVWLHKRLLVWLYLLNLLFAAVLVFPFRRLVEVVARTDLADDFVRGFDLGSFGDLWIQYCSQFESLAYSAVGLAGVYLLFSVFLSGGIVATLSQTRRVSLRRFCTNAGRYFWRYLRLFMVLAVVVGTLAVGYRYSIWRLVTLLEDNATTDRAATLWRGAGVLVAVVLFSAVMMAFDYAKVRTVIEGRGGMIAATARAFGFSLRRLFRTMLLFWLNVLIVIAMFAAYVVVEDRFSNATTESMLGLFAVQQAFILSRIWMKLSFFSSQLAFYQAEQSPQ